MNKKLISSLLTVAMAINIFAIMPLNAFAIGSKSEVYEKDGYTVTYRIGSEWDNNRSVEVTIENTGDEAILNWALKYDTGGEVYNLWNSKIYDSTEEYTIIKNNGYNYEIEPGRSANYGYIVKGAETLIPENIELCCRRIDVKSGYDVDFSITNNWHTGFQAEIAITNTSAEPIEAWTLGFDSNFDINNIWNAKLLSSEEQRYVTANQLWTTPINPGASASFGFTADKSATENAWAENFTLTAVVVGESSLEKEPEIDYELDTDSDGLPDYYEEIIGSDPKTEHSDDDQLPDGYEALYLGTDPSKSDSDDNGISDADEDFDTDGLTNLEEYNLGTDPFLEDSDYDTLSDKDEVNIHGTNPTKGDTDDDLVPDGDEVKLGLDPNSGSTNGTPDSERTFSQIVTAESEVLAAVNDDEETPFDVSLEITAAGVAESNVYARESGYSNAIENPSIIGIAPEFVYTDGLEVEEVTVKFELDDSIVDNTLGTYVSSSTEFEGIKRLNVFMFFEDINMLLPVETFHDEATNTVYTTTDRMGTYCLVDMELFFNNLDIAPSDDEIEKDYDIETQEILDEPVFSSYNISELKINTGYTEYKDNFDVAFVIDEVNYTDEEIAAICEKIRITSITIWKYSPNATICVYGLNGNGVTHCNWYGRAALTNDATDGGRASIDNCLDKVSSKHSVVTSPVVSKAIDYVAEAYIEGRSEYCFVFYNAGNSDYHISGKEDSKKTLYNINAENKNINISVISNYEGDKNSYDELMVNETDGIRIAEHVGTKEFLKDAFKHIYGRTLPGDSTYEYSMGVFANNWKQVELNAPITYLYYDLSRRDDLTIEDIEYYYDCVDTDLDGLYDFQEIMFSYNGKDTIIFESTELDGEILKLYTLSEIAGTGSIYDLPVYVENVIRNMEYLSDEYIEFITTPLIFIYSDPTSGDGDRDTIADPYDIYPLVTFNYTTTKFSEFVDTAEFFEILFIFECPMMKGYTSDECVDCIEILRKYKDTNNIEAFQREMIDSGLVSPDAASSASWFDKIMWGAWAENKSAPLLNEYENYSKDTSFEKMFEESWHQWSATCKIAFEFYNITIRYLKFR